MLRAKMISQRGSGCRAVAPARQQHLAAVPAHWRPVARPGAAPGQQQRARVVRHSAKAAELLAQGHQRYSSKDYMAAAKLYEDAMRESDITSRQRQAAMYGQTAVHASFGDIELAQITLREAIRDGLDFEQALADPDLPDLVTSPQMLIQLRRFNTTAAGAAASRGAAAAGAVAAARARAAAAGRGNPLSQDLGAILGTPTSDTAAIDTSVGAVIKRVALVVLALAGLGTALFFIGLETVMQVN